ncbi:aminotransferase class I/II-fold pyridoxal phosphate-dependent enzyme [Alicyclobacillus fastidiosus]|uniref:Aminotransferase n=1 Tax=Alicyclobacillus fastidiosus TaxID=392011 RepID=A0ABY6ZGB0_9BACL|nr:aminotransferase class I/II-fold pyridoxal phosphate-dependent enzyme [Alicyclobacillus fastidiosus]WAH41897.1 aminotransferase class I/II-fold pyridoxal phosphate-dependent enzyme [Alicyclobacillus fastidiosus]GMA63609.1 putative N-acetyl-LL-diaminopimelate aminotransferase [Alicyclobacillus fastidiosus]
MHQLNPVTEQIQISGIRRFTDLVAKYPDALSLTIGQPHWPTPQHVKEAAMAAIEKGYTTYTPNRGLPALLQAAHAYYGTKFDLDYHPEKEILVTAGATHALDISLRALLEPGDEVLIPGPAYPGYEPIVLLAGAKPVYIDTRADGFKVTSKTLQANITRRTKVLVLPSPANPTGVAYTREELEALAAVLQSTGVYVITDEIYSELHFADGHVSFATLPGMRSRTIVIHGLSKSHSMTGWRIGFVLAPAEIAQQMVKVLQYSISCASSISQYAALEALSHGQRDAEPMREQYRQNRDMVVRALTEMGLEVVVPDGAFYAFPDVSTTGQSSQAFAQALLHEARVAVVPGDAFSALGEGYIRLSYACEEQKLEAALARIGQYVARRTAQA